MEADLYIMAYAIFWPAFVSGALLTLAVLYLIGSYRFAFPAGKKPQAGRLPVVAQPSPSQQILGVDDYV